MAERSGSDEGLALLLAPQGWALLGALPPYDEHRTLALCDTLAREGFPPALIAAALTQSRLRAAARAKFGDFADEMLFTAAGLEQATRLVVAAHHARRYRDAGSTLIADLTTGIGADAMAFAGVGLHVLAAEIDETTAALATVNLMHFPQVRVVHGDGLALDLTGVDAIYADPARRRRSGGRVFDPAAFAPPMDAVLALRERVPALGVKLGPGLAHSAVPVDASAQWVSVDGDVVEVGLWFGPLAPEGPGRSALVLARGSAHIVTGGAEQARTGPVADYLYEPDGAVIRAGLVARVADDLDGWLVDRTIAYLTAEHLVAHPAATAFRVVDNLAFGVKPLRTYLRERGIGRLEIKKRGTAVTPEQLRSQLALRGDGSATVVLTRVDGAQRVLVVERV